MRVERIGDATLYLGDCRDVLPTLGKVDAVVTDPPYGIGFASQPTMYQRANGMVAIGWDDAAADVGLVRSVASIARDAIIWGGNYFALPPSRGGLSWTKPDSPPSMADFELAWTSMDMNAKRFEKSVKSSSLERNFTEGAHPTQKPTALMQWCLGFVPNAQTILDPFMGSGTTGVACAHDGRRFIGIEREPAYFDIACKRIADAYAQPRLFAPSPPAKPVQPSMFEGVAA